MSLTSKPRALLGPALEGVEVAGRVRLRGRGLVNEPTEVDEVRLRCRTLFESYPAPPAHELLWSQSRHALQMLPASDIPRCDAHGSRSMSGEGRGWGTASKQTIYLPIGGEGVRKGEGDRKKSRGTPSRRTGRFSTHARFPARFEIHVA